jgi:hypothetical protein
MGEAYEASPRMITSKITSKAQTTIPKPCATRYGCERVTNLPIRSSGDALS